MKITQVVLFALALVAGLVIGRKTVESPPTQTSEPAPSPVCESQAPKENCAEFENFKSHLQGVTPEQIREYLRTQNAEEKLKKADQILAQIMQVLVADIGFRLQKEEVDQLGHASVAIDNQPPPAKEEIPRPETKPKRDQNRIRISIRNAQSEEQAKKVLTSMGMDFSERLRNSGNLTRDEIQNLNGHYEGTLRYLRPGPAVRMTFDFQGRLSGKNVEGNALVVIFDDRGRANSQARSNGRLSSNYSGTENSVFVKVGGSYLELVYFPNLDLWMGSYLEMDRGLLQKSGDVVLRRQ